MYYSHQARRAEKANVMDVTRPTHFVLTLLAALFFGALVVLAHGRVRVIDELVVLRAVVAGAHLLAALGLLAFPVLTLHVVRVVDQSVPRRTLDGVAVDRVCGWHSNSYVQKKEEYEASKLNTNDNLS